MELMRDGQDTFGKELPSVFEFGHGVRRESRAALSFGEYMGISKAAQHQGLVSETFVLRSLIDIKMGHLNLHILERPAAELGSVDCCHCHLALAFLSGPPMFHAFLPQDLCLYLLIRG